MATLNLVGSSAKFRALLDNVDLVAPVDSAVLIQGETGTGKEVIARAIHEASPRRRNRFVALNCAAIPSALLESELFGYEKGAFTGAANQTIRRFQVADRGTLFLDEIGDLPLEAEYQSCPPAQSGLGIKTSLSAKERRRRFRRGRQIRKSDSGSVMI